MAALHIHQIAWNGTPKNLPNLLQSILHSKSLSIWSRTASPRRGLEYPIHPHCYERLDQIALTYLWRNISSQTITPSPCDHPASSHRTAKLLQETLMKSLSGIERMLSASPTKQCPWSFFEKDLHAQSSSLLYSSRTFHPSRKFRNTPQPQNFLDLPNQDTKSKIPKIQSKYSSTNFTLARTAIINFLSNYTKVQCARNRIMVLQYTARNY